MSWGARLVTGWYLRPDGPGFQFGGSTRLIMWVHIIVKLESDTGLWTLSLD